MFAMGRRGLIDSRVGVVHPANRTPANAVLVVGGATAICMFLGDAILVPITEVGSVAAASGWLAACAAYYAMGPPVHERLIAAVGVLIGLAMILMKVVPGIPGHFTIYEWISLAIWIAIGALLVRRGPEQVVAK
jgi:amino acid transporter